MNSKIIEKINLFIKNKILNDFIQHKNFLKTLENKQELLHLIEIQGELWISIYHEEYFENLIKKKQINNFTPFFLFPVKLNNYIKEKDEETNNDFYIKFNSINITTILNKDVFYIKNTFKHNKIKKNQPIIKLDKKRKIKYIFTNDDKKIIIKEIKKLKQLDVFNIFKIEKLLYFIEEKLKKYIENQENYFFVSSLNNNLEMIDLKTITIKKEFKNSKPIYFTIKEDNIQLNISED